MNVLLKISLWTFSLLVLVSCETTSVPYSVQQKEIEKLSAVKTKSINKKIDKNFYEQLEEQINNYREIESTYKLPELSIHGKTISMGQDISKYVKSHFMFGDRTFKPLKPTVSPKKCQKLFLISNYVENAESVMKKASEIAIKTKDMMGARIENGISVYLGNLLKTRALLLISKSGSKNYKKNIREIISSYGYPEKVQLPKTQGAEVLAWGLRHKGEKIYIFDIPLSAYNFENKGDNFKLSYILAYNKTKQLECVK